jgi:hypothetical protein
VTGAEHTRAAEQLLDAAKAIHPAATAEGAYAVDRAQVHATLAVAAEQRRLADILDAASDGDGVRVYATVEGTSFARAVRVDARQP